MNAADQRIESEYPIAVTVSYTLFVTAFDQEHALKIANNMSTEEVIANISGNPTIELEEAEIDG